MPSSDPMHSAWQNHVWCPETSLLSPLLPPPVIFWHTPRPHPVKHRPLHLWSSYPEVLWADWYVLWAGTQWFHSDHRLTWYISISLPFHGGIWKRNGGVEFASQTFTASGSRDILFLILDSLFIFSYLHCIPFHEHRHQKIYTDQNNTWNMIKTFI